MRRLLIAGGLVATCLAVPTQALAIPVYSANGTVAEITGTVDSFRAAVGTLNSGAINATSGRREINWDGVPDASADPGFIAGDFFNLGTGGRARGLEFSSPTPGAQFMVSANAGGSESVAFGYPGDFTAFSAQRMFATVGGLVTEVRFFDPTRPAVRATTSAFGAVFEDVETAGDTTLSYYDLNDQLLLTVEVAAGASGSLSFGGAVFESAAVGKVVIHTGNAILFADGSYGPGADGVVMDDFIYGEPQPVPEPSTYAMFALGLVGLGVAARRRSRG